jgi:hypothetical protein
MQEEIFEHVLHMAAQLLHTLLSLKYPFGQAETHVLLNKLREEEHPVQLLTVLVQEAHVDAHGRQA